MIDLRYIAYRVVVVTPDGTQLDVTDITTNLGWEEGERELAIRISMNLYNAQYKGKMMSELVQPGTPVFIYATTLNGAQNEVARGTVSDWKPTFSNSATSLELVIYDEANALRHNQENRYYSDGIGTTAAITAIFKDWNIPYDYQGPEATHTKMVFKKAYLSDMIMKILDDAEKKGAEKCFVRAKEGKIQVLARGRNDDIYHFDAMDNTISAKDSFSSSTIVTRVVIVGKADQEGHQAIEDTKDGKTEFGVRQVIYERPQDKSLEDSQKAANDILKEKGDIKRKTSLQAPDVPFIRKGDRIRVKAGTVTGYFFIKSIRHNAADRKMTMELDEDKAKNAESNSSNGSGTTTSG